MRRLGIVPLVLLALSAGCAIDREGTGLGPMPGVDGGTMMPDTGQPPVDGGPFDAGTEIPDAGRRRDAGGCAPGTHDIDRRPENGCEYTCTPTPAPAEVCDGDDNDCDGRTDNIPMTEWIEFFVDEDDDGYGTPAMRVTGPCTPPVGFARNADDCRDSDAMINPGATERCNAVDDDCNGVLDDGATCPCALLHHGDPVERPYLFCETDETWEDADAMCMALGYRLVTINDETENSFIYSTARPADGGGWWIGFNDRDSEMDWEWVAGGATTSYTRWRAMEPNDGAGPGTDEDCATTGQFGGGDPTWNDYPCDTARPYVCEVIP